MQIINISSYKFIQLDRLPTLKAQLLVHGQRLELRGTILLAPEGINIMLAAVEPAIDEFIEVLTADPRFADTSFKRSISEQVPFERFKVRLKKEIITMGDATVEPLTDAVPTISAEQFKQWLDEGRDITVLDTRNRYEIEFGGFEQAIDLKIDNFREFPAACSQMEDELKHKPMVMFCTGGVRCEKAGIAAERAGFKQVYQLEGGILKYFEQCGGAHYKGDCFVFDERVAVNPQLEPVEGRNY